MTLTKKQELLYASISDIDEKYVAEALSHTKRAVPIIWKRIGIVAAAFLVLVGMLYFASGNDSDLLFSLTVDALGNGDSFIIIEAEAVEPYRPASDHPKDDLSVDWRDYDLFSVRVRTDGFSEAYLKSTYVVVEYETELLTSRADTANIAVRLPVNELEAHSRQWLCTVYGWTDDHLEFTISIYHSEGDKNILLHRQSFSVNYDGRYFVNGVTTEPYIDPMYRQMTTDQLLDTILNDEDLWEYATLSSDLTHSKFYRKYEGQLTELETRENAGSIMLQKLQVLMNMTEEDFQADFVQNGSRQNILCQLLTFDCFQKHLTESELALLEQLVLSKYPAE